MKSEQPIAKGRFLLNKFEGKGGWTYAELPDVQPASNVPFGWVTVKGTIDGQVFKQHKLMPMGGGRLFFSVNAALCKKIKKKAGDVVELVVYMDKSSWSLPEEIRSCFELEPKETYRAFLTLTEGEQRSYIKWILEAKRLETRALRIVKMMEELVKQR
jgi:hypothetical protein